MTEKGNAERVGGFPFISSVFRGTEEAETTHARASLSVHAATTGIVCFITPRLLDRLNSFGILETEKRVYQFVSGISFLRSC